MNYVLFSSEVSLGILARVWSLYMGLDHSIHALFCLPLDDAVARFVELRAEYLGNRETRMHAEHSHTKEQINRFASDVQSRIAYVRTFHPLYRAHSISTKLLPLWHRYDMHPHFPSVMRKLPECLEGDSDARLDALDEAVCREKETALASLLSYTE